MTVLYDQYEMEAKCKTKINRLSYSIPALKLCQYKPKINFDVKIRRIAKSATLRPHCF